MFKILKEQTATIGNITTIKLNVSYDERDYIVHAETNPVTQQWEQWGAPSEVLCKTTATIQRIFREKMLSKAKGVFSRLY